MMILEGYECAQHTRYRESIMPEDAPVLSRRADGVRKRCRCFLACFLKRPIDRAARRAFVSVAGALDDMFSRFEHGDCVGFG